MDARAHSTAYEFGDFRVDAQQRVLLLKANGRALPISSRALDLLIFFLEHPGELLDKSTLMAAVWPKVVVEENNLNQHISAIRRLLGDRPEEHRYIVTVPGRGYRFVAAVHPVPDASGGAPGVAGPEVAAKSHTNWLLWVTATGGLALAVCLGGYLATHPAAGESGNSATHTVAFTRSCRFASHDLRYCHSRISAPIPGTCFSPTVCTRRS